MKSKSHRFALTSLVRGCLSTTCAAFCASQSASALDGTWTNDGSSTWSTPGNWAAGIVADGSGFTANFNTIDITADRTVSLDGDRAITNLNFGDTEVATTPAGWILDNNGNSANNLILAGTNPTITVNALGTGKSTTISAIIEGSAATGTTALVKAGAGSLVLAGSNTFTGNVNHFSAGSIVLKNSSAFGSGPKNVAMNSANVTLRLDGSGGDLSLPSDTSFSTAGLQTGGSIINVAGNNTINGPITLNSGASGTAFSVDAGTLTLANTVRITGGTVRALTLRGGGNGTISGVILNGGASLPVNKETGAGIWTLSGANTYTGGTTVSAGTLKAGIASTTGPDSGPFGVNSSVTVNASGTLDVTGFDTRINALIGTGTVTLGSANLTIGTANANSTFDGTIAGTGGSITKTGTGAQRLGASASTFTGGATVLNGDLIVTNSAALGSGTLTLAGVVNQIDNFGIEGGVDFTNSINIDLTTQRSGISALTSGENTLSGPITISNSGANNTVVISNNVNSSIFTVSGAISSSTANLTLSFRGSGTGSSGVVSNTLSLAAGAGVDLNGATNWTFSGTGSTWGLTRIFGPGNMILGANNALSTTAVTGDGTGTGAIDLAGFNQAVGGLAGLAVRSIGNSSTSADSVLSINAASPQTYSGAIADVLGSGTRKVSVVLDGGTQTLAGTNTYTGPTTLNSGTLVVSGSLATTALEVKNTATLAGTGPLGGNVAVRSGGRQAFEIAASTGTQVVRMITGSLTLDSGNILDLTAAAPPAIGGPYILLTASGGIAGTPGVVNLNGLTGTVTKNGNNLELTVTAASGFSSWITGTFANGTVPGGQQGTNDDPDGDGVSNLVEYAVAGLDPTVSNGSVGSFAASTFTVSKRQPLASDITYAIEESTDLGSSDPWLPVTPTVNNNDTISYVFPGGPARDFLRLKIVKP